jgi:hypothetical protein
MAFTMKEFSGFFVIFELMGWRIVFIKVASRGLMGSTQLQATAVPTQTATKGRNVTREKIPNAKFRGL